MRVMMHIVPHIAMIGLIVFFCLINYKKGTKWIMNNGEVKDYNIFMIVVFYILFFSWLPSVLIECILY